MTAIIDPAVERYFDEIRGRRDDILQEMETLAEEKNFPIVGPDVGRLLFALARFGGARRVLELGSGYGYSAYWFAKALPDGAEVHCIDSRADHRDQAENYFKRAGMSARLRFHVGEALAVARKIAGPFDIVFNDIDKEHYPESIELAASLLRDGGLFVTDNALWHGKVTEPDPDAPTQGVLEFNRRLASDPRFESVVLPLRDGVSVAVKIGTKVRRE